MYRVQEKKGPFLERMEEVTEHLWTGRTKGKDKMEEGKGELWTG